MKTISFCVLSLLFLAGIANAGGLKQGRIVSMHVANSLPNLVFIKIDGAYATGTTPACRDSSTHWDYVLDISTSTGKAVYSLALMAQAASTTVVAEGFGSCNLRTGYEDFNYLDTNT